MSRPVPPSAPGRPTVCRAAQPPHWRCACCRPTPAAAWLTLRRPLLDDEPASPLAQAASAADLVAGISQLAHPAKLGFVNADLTLYLRRVPQGKWIGLDARTLPGPLGTGYATGTLHDADGAFGQCSASLLIDARV